MRSNIPLLVLAGGFGSRLKGVVNNVPKPLAPVCGRPFLYYVLEDWIESGVQRFIFLLHYQANLVDEFLQEYFETKSELCLSYTCLVEPHPLGTGGAVRFAIRDLNFPSEVLVCNADTWLPGGVRYLLKEQADCIAAVKVDSVGRYGSLQSNKGFVSSFSEKSDSQSSGLINAGIYRLATQHFLHREVGEVFSLEEHILTPLASLNKLRFKECGSVFVDIGIPSDYFKFCEWVERGLVNEV
jgi:D-glycero-alpha-D-manno-heptose 1-phosphate guanylyltransferase